MPAVKSTRSVFAAMVPKLDPRIASKQAAPPPAVKQPEAVKEPVKPALLFRGRPGDSWLKIMFRNLRKKVSPDNPSVGNLHHLAELLAGTSQFVELGARIASEPVTRRFWIATVKLVETTPAK